MKKIITYEAFDGEEFDTEEACRAYENERIDTMREMNETYSFYDKDMNKWLDFPEETNDFESMIDWLDDAYNECEYIRVKKKPSDEVTYLAHNYFGYLLPIGDRGLYRYENGWERVAD